MMARNMVRQWYSVLHGILILSVSLEASSSLVSAKSAEVKLMGVAPDRFVEAAPLIVGASCSDGSVLIAVHTIFAEEPLLVDGDISGSSNDDNDNIAITDQRLLDIPREYRGPFRISSVDSFGTAVASAGWRADGQLLTKYCRHLAREELSLFGVPRCTSDYGNHIASEASVWMARAALSESLRPLSCAALLASCGDSDSPGFVWLVDSTGAYRVQAHAVGGGALAGKVNNALATLKPSDLTTEDVCKRLVDILSDMEDIPRGSRLEIATVGVSDAKRRTVTRHLVSSIRD